MTYLGEHRTRRRWLGSALVALLGAAMVTSTLLQGALGVLSRFILDEFGITGLLLDSSDSYPLMWALLAALMVAVTAITAWFRITATRR